MPWTAAQAREHAAPAGQKAGLVHKTKAQARKTAKLAQYPIAFPSQSDFSPEGMLERKIAEATANPLTRPSTIDKLSTALARLRKSGGTKRRPVEPLSHSSMVAAQPLTGLDPGSQALTTSHGVPKESFLPASPLGDGGGGAPSGGGGECVNTQSVSPSPVLGQEFVISGSGSSSQSVWKPAMLGEGKVPVVETAVPVTESSVSEGKTGGPVPCPGPGWTKETVGGVTFWARRNP